MPGTLRPRAPLHHRSEVWPHGLEAAGRDRLWSGWTETVAAPGPAPRGSGVPAVSLGVQVARRLVQTRGSAGDAKQAPNLTQTRLPAAGGAARPRTCLQGLRRGGGGDVQGCWGVHSGRGHAVSPLSSSHSSWRTACLWGQSRGTSSPHPRDSCACQAVGTPAGKVGTKTTHGPGSRLQNQLSRETARTLKLKGLLNSWGLPWWLSWERICLQCGRPAFNPWLGKTPWRRERLPTPVFWLENSVDCIVQRVAKSRMRLSDFHLNHRV